MKYPYKFVNGESVSVEVCKQMLAVLQDEWSAIIKVESQNARER